MAYKREKPKDCILFDGDCGCHAFFACRYLDRFSKEVEVGKMLVQENPLPKEFNDEQQEQEEQQEKERQPVSLKLVGGSSPPADGNWLSELEIGTVFLVRSRQNLNDYNLGLFRLEEKTEKSAVLRTPSIPQACYVYPVNFCKVWSMHENMGVLETKVIEELTETLEQEEPKQGA